MLWNRSTESRELWSSSLSEVRLWKINFLFLWPGMHFKYENEKLFSTLSCIWFLYLGGTVSFSFQFYTLLKQHLANGIRCLFASWMSAVLVIFHNINLKQRQTVLYPKHYKSPGFYVDASTSEQLNLYMTSIHGLRTSDYYNNSENSCSHILASVRYSHALKDQKFWSEASNSVMKKLVF